MKRLAPLLITLTLFVLTSFAATGVFTLPAQPKLSPTARWLANTLQHDPARAEKLVTFDASQSDPEISWIVYGTCSKMDLATIGAAVNTEDANWKTVRMPLSKLNALIALKGVTHIECSPNNLPLDGIANTDSMTGTGYWIGNSAALVQPNYDGTGILVGIADVGTDWKHLDFRKTDTTQSRVRYLWDMAGTTTGGRVHPSGFSYGVEYTQAQINAEFVTSPPNFVTSYASVMHGTTVASIAAGNGNAFPTAAGKGVAPNADYLIAVFGGTSTANIIDAVNWMFQKAAALGMPVVVNISLGGHQGAHDGSRSDEQYISNNVGAGKAIVVAAGNDGNNTGLHAGGTVTVSGTQTTNINVPASMREFVIDLWYTGGDAYRVHVINPSAASLAADTTLDTRLIFAGADTVDVYNGTNTVETPINGDKHVVLDFYGSASNFVASGTWQIQLERIRNSGDGNWDGWIFFTLGSTAAFTTNNSTSKTLTMPGTATNAITVGAYSGGGSYTDVNNTAQGNGANNGLAYAGSSKGPTRTGGHKPDVIAVGGSVRSAKARTYNPGATATLQGGFHYMSFTPFTSFAAPEVTGAVALLFQKYPGLTAAQAKTKVNGGANTDAQTGAAWNNVGGNGKLAVNYAISANSHTFSVTGQPQTFSGTKVSANFSVLPGGSWLVYADRFDSIPSNLGGVNALPFYVNMTSPLTNGTFTTTLTFNYTVTEAGAMNKNALTICYWNGANWIPLTNQTRDTTSHFVTGESNHFTKFAVLELLPQIATTPADTVHFGNVVVNTTQSDSVWVRNPGNWQVSISNVTTPANVTPSWTTQAINASDSALLVLSWSPTATGTLTGNVTFTSNAVASPTLQLPVTGNAVQALISSNPGVVNFGNVLVGNLANTSIMVHDTGAAALVITNVSAPVGVSPSWSSQTIAPGDSSLLSFSWTATAGALSGNVVFTSNAGNGAGDTVAVAGYGVTPPSVPANLQIAYSSGNAVLNWTPAAGDVAGYKVYRMVLTGHFDPTPVRLLTTLNSPTDSTYTDVGVSVQYFYEVTSFTSLVSSTSAVHSPVNHVPSVSRGSARRN